MTLQKQMERQTGGQHCWNWRGIAMHTLPGPGLSHPPSLPAPLRQKPDSADTLSRAVLGSGDLSAAPSPNQVHVFARSTYLQLPFSDIDDQVAS